MLITITSEQRGRTEHPDYFDHILPENAIFPSNHKEQLHIGSIALQLMFAGWGPMADVFYGTIVLLLENPETHAVLTTEIRDTFASYDEIVPSTTLSSMPFLHAVIEETLRMLPNNNTGLPRISPGETVDGEYIPKGVRQLRTRTSLTLHH